MNLIAYSADPDQIARMSWLIWIYTVSSRHVGLYMEERVNNFNKSDILLIGHRVNQLYLNKQCYYYWPVVLLGFQFL
jgi:hypothetical protein